MPIWGTTCKNSCPMVSLMIETNNDIKYPLFVALCFQKFPVFDHPTFGRSHRPKDLFHPLYLLALLVVGIILNLHLGQTIAPQTWWWVKTAPRNSIRWRMAVDYPRHQRILEVTWPIPLPKHLAPAYAATDQSFVPDRANLRRGAPNIPLGPGDSPTG